MVLCEVQLDRVKLMCGFAASILKAMPFQKAYVCAIGLTALLTLGSQNAYGQDNYEIQVYGSDTVAPQTTMLELHSNFTVDGSKAVPGSKFAADGTYPTNHAEHETIEITQGLNDWSEVGFYIFTSERSGQGVQWVGDHIRPRVRVPDSWHWPVGVSLSTEIGYQRRVFSTDTWRGKSAQSSINRSADGTLH